MERVAGAPSLPVLTERDQRIAQLQQMLRDKELTEDEFLAAMAELRQEDPAVAQAAMAELRQEDPAVAQAAMAEAGWSPEAIQDILSGVERREGGLGDWAERTLTPGGMEFQRKAAADANRFDRQMSNFDREMGIAMGQIDPEAESAEVMSVPPEEVDQYWNLTEAQRGAKLGGPWGGGTPFKNDYARDRYYERPAMDRNKEAALREAGVPEADIRMARMSPEERDMLRSGDQGWVNVYAAGHDGRAVPRQRAPAPSAMRDDGTPNPDTLLPANADIATGGYRVGDRVDNRDVQAGLRNQTLEAQGYVPTSVAGPNGFEWVYELPPEVKAARAAQGRATMKQMSIDRLRGQAGVTDAVGPPGEGEAARLRSLIAQSRVAEKNAQQDAFRKSRMNPRMRAETGLADIGGPEMNDWQNFVLAQNLAQNADPTTPLAAEAFMNQQLLRGLQQQMTGRGFNGNDAATVLGLRTLEMQNNVAERERIIGLRNEARTRARGWGMGEPSYEAAREYLYDNAANEQEAESILASMFPNGPEDSPPAREPRRRGRVGSRRGGRAGR
jgi:hypothetical protein